MDISVNDIVLESNGTFVPNIPSSKRKLYTYHSEQHWLPFRKNFVNIWVPLFKKKLKNSGTMIVKPFSHLDTHEFSEYRGYLSNNDETHYTQYDIPKKNLAKYPTLHINAKPGDLILFHQNLLHSSELNITNEVGYLYVNRYFDISKDLTISDKINLRPYSDESIKTGRPLSF